MILLLLPLLWLLSVSPVFANPPQYEITATYQEESHLIEGAERITFINDGDHPLPELYLFVYPNIFMEKDPDIDPGLYKKAYPIRFNPGEMRIISIQDAEGNALSYFPDFFKKKILMKIPLPTPIPPKGSYALQVRFVTTIPEKWGGFGYYRNQVTLQGGWNPYIPSFVDGKWKFLLAPPKSRFRIHFSIGEHLQFMASGPPQFEEQKGPQKTFLLEGDDLPFYSFSIGQRLFRIEDTADPIRIVYQARLEDKKYAEETVAIAQDAASFFLEHSAPLPPTVLQLAESDLYQDLTTAGSKILYLNSRLFKVFPPLRRFHEASVARGVFLLLWRERLPWEEAWVSEGLADLDMERFMRGRYGKVSSLEQWLKPFSFIPVIDQLLYSKDIPFRQVYFREPVAPAFNEDIQFFNHSRPEGTTIFSKIKNLLGHSTFERTVASYRNRLQSREEPSFRETLRQASGKDLGWFFDQWLIANPALDFEIADVRESKVDGGYQTAITIKKQGEGIEPLEIIAYEKNGSIVPWVWEGEEETREEVLITPSPIRVIELDPHGESSDPNKLNNRVPRLWKVLVNQIHVGHDLQTGVTSYSAGLLFQPVYDTRNRFGFNFSHSDHGNATHIEYSHIFKDHHTVTEGISYEVPQTAQDRPREIPAGTLHLGYSLNFPDVPLFARYIQQIAGQYPNFSFGLKYDQRFTGGQYDRSITAQTEIRRFYSFSIYHEIGGRILIGESFGDLFKNSRFFLGGTDQMRGYTPLRFEGDNIILISAEYRFPIFYETDLNLGGLALMRTLQGVLFADTGTVTDSANQLQVVHYKADAGAGLRWNVDWFGIYPITLRFDVAVPINSPVRQEQKPHYYLTAGQSF